jgi:hypothetical protein
MNNVISGLALAVAIASLLLAWAAFKLQRRRTNMELARSLHHDLTSGEVAKARETLGSITRDQSVAPREDLERRRAWFVGARTDYFTLLWCFERIWAGRETIIDDDRRGVRSRPCRYLDQLVGWHVRNWAFDLPEIKRVLINELSEMPEQKDGVRDEDSSRAFGKLTRALLDYETEKRLADFLRERGLQHAGYDTTGPDDGNAITAR